MNMNKSRLGTLSLALVAVAALPLGLAAPAQAATTRDGCTVNPLPAEFRGTYNGQYQRYVYYPYEVSCIASGSGLSVEVKTETWESDRAGWFGDVDADGIDNADEDSIGSTTSNTIFGAAGGATTVNIRGVLPQTDTDSDEEVYHKVKFRVTSGPVTGGWTTFELTQATTIDWS